MDVPFSYENCFSRCEVKSGLLVIKVTLGAHNMRPRTSTFILPVNETIKERLSPPSPGKVTELVWVLPGETYRLESYGPDWAR